ncbi:hypothetical protein BDW74DRAFT_175464 [Aspergillus multicolor]|uniref:uncharacterized protein n=1 Tax=Aspergillus multicolor TaxID=41759 RepID=UPI003CCCDBAF
MSASTGQGMDAPNETAQVPRVASRHTGWYDAPNGKRYFGLGVVTEIGLTHDGSTYTKVEPEFIDSDLSDSELIKDITPPDKEFRFIDPVSNKDMPLSQYPEDPTLRWRKRRNKPRRECLLKPKPDLGPGDMGPGERFTGVGRIVRPARAVAQRQAGNHEFSHYCIEPAPVAGGILAWGGGGWQREDCRSGSSTVVTRFHTSVLDNWYGKLPPMVSNEEGQPLLRVERAGAYFAPDGQWFAGVGKVITVGYIRQIGGSKQWYVYMEPIPGKTGWNYDFFHPLTGEWMNKFPSNAIPVGQCSSHPALRKYHGRYCPPKAPKRDVYVGAGKVAKTGVDNQGTRVEVVPIPSKRDNLNYMFWDPWSGEKMPAWYWPAE